MGNPIQAYGAVKTQLRNRLQPQQSPGPYDPPEPPEAPGTQPTAAPPPPPGQSLSPSPAPSPAPAPAERYTLPGQVGGNTGYGAGIGASGGAQPAPAARGSFNYEAARDDWMGNPEYRAANPAEAKQKAAIWAERHGIEYNGSDVITLPNGGGQIDILGNFGGGAGNGQAIANNWTPAGGNGPNPNGQPAGGAGAPGAAASGGFNGDVKALLMAQLQAMSQPVTEDDPAIAGELQSQKRQIERDRMARRAAMAERAAAGGLLAGGASSGAFDADVAQGYEDASTRGSDVRTRLFDAERGARREKLGQLLSLAIQSGDRDAANAIQLQIAQMGNALGYANLGQQASQWNDQFGLNSAAFQYQQQQDALGGF